MFQEGGQNEEKKKVEKTDGVEGLKFQQVQHLWGCESHIEEVFAFVKLDLFDQKWQKSSYVKYGLCSGAVSLLFTVLYSHTVQDIHVEKTFMLGAEWKRSINYVMIIQSVNNASFVKMRSKKPQSTVDSVDLVVTVCPRKVNFDLKSAFIIKIITIHIKEAVCRAHT